ncbi:MAG TPA: hypothetical protein VF797_04390 [Noviherbaspirillum sp.]
MIFLRSVVNDGALTLPDDIQVSNRGNAKPKLASRQRRGYDVSTQNHRKRIYMPAPLSSASSSVEQPTPGAACIQPGSLWQRMINSWIHTYALCSGSGTVPFLLL